MSVTNQTRLAELRHVKVKPVIDEATVAASQRLIQQLQQLKRQLKDTLAIEGLCVAERNQ
jgi:hypothetical protein